MSDSRLRELERRWQETGASEDWAAYLREQVRTGMGVVRDAEGFLQAAHTLAAEKEEFEGRALALAHVGWGYAELGVGDRAVALATAVEEVAEESRPAVRARALARVGALRERVDGAGAGSLAFERAAKLLKAALPQRESDDPIGVEEHDALIACLADVATAVAGRTRTPEVLATLDEILSAMPMLSLSHVVGPAGAALRSVGLADRVAARLRPEVAERWWLGAVAVGVTGLTEDAASGLAAFKASPDSFGRPTLELLRRCIAAHEDPESAVAELTEAVEASAAELVWIAGARWAPGRAFEVGRRRLGSESLDGVAPLLKHAPELLKPDEALAFVRDALAAVEATGGGQEVFLAAVEALSGLPADLAGPTLDALIHETIAAAERDPDEIRVLYERLDACVEAARALKLPGLLGPARSAAKAGLIRTAGLDGQGVFALNLLHVAFAGLALGDRERFEEDGAPAFAALPRLRLLDRMYVYPELTALVGRSTLDLRHTLGRHVLQLAGGWDPAPGSDRVLTEMLDDLCAAAVRFDR